MDELLYFDWQLTANARYESIGGRDYFVADAVILKHGVLPGSDGPLYYPIPEISADVGLWNGFPITARHPTLNGKSVSARNPSIAHSFQVGTVYNDRFAGDERWVELWFDVVNADRIDWRIMPAVKSGRPINVSTGIFTGKIVENSVYNGRAYTHRVRGIRPDHLAVLMDEKGACSVDDGCGINVSNSFCPTGPGGGVDSSCGSGGGGSGGHKVKTKQDAVKAISDHVGKDISKIVKSTRALKDEDGGQIGWKVKFHRGTAVTVKSGYSEKRTASVNVTYHGAITANSVASTLNAGGNAMAESKCPKCGAMMKDGKCKCGYEEKPTENRQAATQWLITNCGLHEGTLNGVSEAALLELRRNANPVVRVEQPTREQILNAVKALSVKDYIENAPAGAKELLDAAKSVHDRERISVIEKLVANESSVEVKKSKLLKLKDKTLPQLQELLEFSTNAAPAAAKKDDEDDKYLANFFKSGTPTAAATDASATGSDKVVANRKNILMPNAGDIFAQEPAA